MAKRIKLEWWIGSNGNEFADHGGKRYCVATEWKGGYRVAVNGKEIGRAGLHQVAKGIAEDYANELSANPVGSEGRYLSIQDDPSYGYPKA